MKKCIKMYENNFNNPHETSLEELDKFLRVIADLDEEIEFYAMGGTAMVLKGIKEATKDIDFYTTAKYDYVKKMFEIAGLKENSSSGVCNKWNLGKTRIDIFYKEFILGVPFQDDWKEQSEKIKEIGKVKLYILSWYDIIITKLARSENRDIEDIKIIIKEKIVDFKELKKRYYETADTAIISDYDLKFKHFEREFKK